jgi:5-aminovalerate/4-aminobutyrate aminotransferase
VHQVFAESADGAVLTDVDGNQFIDFTGGSACSTSGHLPPPVVDAVTAQLARFTHTCFHVVRYDGYVRLAETLAGSPPVTSRRRRCWSTAGAEAVENAVKIARYATGVRVSWSSTMRSTAGRSSA